MVPGDALAVGLSGAALDSQILQPLGSLLKLALAFFFFRNIAVNTSRLMLPRRGDSANVCSRLVIMTVTASACRASSVRGPTC